MLDHVVFVAHDLDATVAEYRGRGFTVTPGGEHVEGITHNALVAFSDGAYLELVGFRKAAPQHRWWRHSGRGGYADFAVLSDDLAADVAALGALVSREPADGGRVRPDGISLRWRTALLAPPLPFLIEDLTPRDRRVPGGDAARHANGTTGIASIVVGCRDLGSAERAHARLRELGAPDVTLRGGANDGIEEVRFARGAR
ncbi:MAG: VOC family protein [Chloroflexota bacterium]